MANFVLGRKAVRAIHSAVSGLFARAKARFLGREYGPKEISFGARPIEHRHDLSLPAIFDASSRSEGMRPNPEVKETLMRVAAGYLDAHEALAKVKVVNAVQSFLNDAAAQGTNTDVKTVLGGQLADLMGKVTTDVKRIVDTESTRARNAGTLDAVTKINTIAGVSDPLVYFVVVRDGLLCSECKRLHLRPDGRPRVWRLSQVGHGYHKRGDPNPKVSGLHPHCRCSLVTILKGYGFDAAGKLTYIGPDHDEAAWQLNNPA